MSNHKKWHQPSSAIRWWADTILTALLFVLGIIILVWALVGCTPNEAFGEETTTVVIETSTGRLEIIHDVVNMVIGNPDALTLNVKPEGDGKEMVYEINSPSGVWILEVWPPHEQNRTKAVPTRVLLLLREIYKTNHN